MGQGRGSASVRARMAGGDVADAAGGESARVDQAAGPSDDIGPLAPADSVAGTSRLLVTHIRAARLAHNIVPTTAQKTPGLTL
jgi:hypothetical protein